MDLPTERVLGIGGLFCRTRCRRTVITSPGSAQLRAANIEVKVDPEKYPAGRFARLHDPEVKPIELWEAADPA